MKEFLKNNLKTIVAVVATIVILLFMTNSCNNNKLDKLRTEQAVLEEKYNTQENELKKLKDAKLKEADSLNKVIVIREEENTKIRKEKSILEQRIKDILNREPIKAVDGQGLAVFFSFTYKTNEVQFEENKLSLSVKVGNLARADIIRKDQLEEVLPLKDIIIGKQEEEISNLEKDKIDLRVLLKSSNDYSLKQDEQLDLGKKLNENLKTQIKSLNNKTLIYKILIPTAAVTGFLIGTQIK